MPVASTVSKSTAAKPARKTRSRKAATPKKVATAKVLKATAKPKQNQRPSSARLISSDRYIKDIQTRWAIHQWEVRELIKDVQKGFNIIQPYHQQLVNQFKN